MANYVKGTPIMSYMAALTYLLRYAKSVGMFDGKHLKSHLRTAVRANARQLSRPNPYSTSQKRIVLE